MSVFQDFIAHPGAGGNLPGDLLRLGQTYSITQPIIDRLAIETANAARAEVLPARLTLNSSPLPICRKEAWMPTAPPTVRAM